MIRLTTEQARQIEDALKRVINDWVAPDDLPFEDGEMPALDGTREALATIRAARAQEQAEQEPVAFHRASFLSGYEAAQSDANSCDVPPQGWLCTRQAGHDGPCAAIADDKGIELVNRAMARLADQEAAPVQQAEQEPVAGGRCIIIESCKRCPHSFGRQSCALAERAFDEPLKRSTIPPMWCPLPLYAAPQPAQQEPVGEVVMESMGVGDAQIVRFRMNGRIPPVGTKLYAAPVRTKDLTKEEIQNAMMPIEPTGKDYFLRLARAVIAKFKEKNK